MVCPYFWQGKTTSGCVAYPEGLMVPSIGEEKNCCTSSDYKRCSYYLKVEERERPWLNPVRNYAQQDSS